MNSKCRFIEIKIRAVPKNSCSLRMVTFSQPDKHLNQFLVNNDNCSNVKLNSASVENISFNDAYMLKFYKYMY